MLQGISIFVSTLSITAIALDRRQLIVHPHRSAVGIRAMLALVPIVWAISIAMASPMAIWKKLEYWTDMPMNHLFDDDVDDGSVYRARQKNGSQVARFFQARPGRSGKQQQEQSSRNLGTVFCRALYTDRGNPNKWWTEWFI